MKNKIVWICEDCLGGNLEKDGNGEIKEWITLECDGGDGENDIENYCFDCESMTIKQKG